MELDSWRNPVNFFLRRKERERKNLETLENLTAELKPDRILIFGLWNIPRSVPAFLESRYPDRVVYRFAEYWPSLPSQQVLYWNANGGAWYRRFPKKALARVALSLLARDEVEPLKFRHVFCVSRATRQQLTSLGVPVSHARVVHTGVGPHWFLPGSQRAETECVRLVYAGRLEPEKGIETGLKAIQILLNEGKRVSLEIAGAGQRDYESRLKEIVKRRKIGNAVRFLGRISPADVRSLFSRSDILLLPSEWPEPFARVVLEGMAAGLAVIASSVGGSSEIIDHGINGLLFSAGDELALAQEISRAAADPILRRRLGQAAISTVQREFTESRMLDRIEEYLTSIGSAEPRPRVDRLSLP